MEELRRESYICGHHIYKEIRNPCLGEVSQCKRDPHNVVDQYKGVVVGHIYREKCQDCAHSSYGEEAQYCIVNGARRHSADLPQGRLELRPRVSHTDCSKFSCRKNFVP